MWSAWVAALLLGAAVAPGQAPPGPFYLEDDSLRVVYWEGQRGAAERTLRAARSPLPLPGLPDRPGGLAGTVLLAPTPAHFDSLTGGGAPAWAAGVAIPARRLIILPAYPRPGAPADPVVTLRHELAHLALNDALPGVVPRWFDEGYATWVSGEWDESSGWQIRLALARGQAPALDSLTLAWPRREPRARLAYLLSASAVRHLATRSGERAFAAFLDTWTRLGSFDAALRATYHLTPGQFEEEWRAMVRRRYGWLLALSQTGVFWVAVTLLVLLFGSRRRASKRARLAEMERQERLEPPWVEPRDDEDPGRAPPGVDGSPAQE